LEDHFQDTWENILNGELHHSNKGLDEHIAGIDINLLEVTKADRKEMESPDSGIDMHLQDVLITDNDPVFNNIDMLEDEHQAVKVVSMELPVIDPEDIRARVSDGDLFDAVQIGESDNDQENCVQEGAEDIHNHIKIHSYSVLTAKNSNRRRTASKMNQKSEREIAPHSKVFKIKTAAGNRKFRATVTSQKRKLYEMAPLTDPAAEKCRQNALNAKINRDRKKKQLEEAETEINQLRSENQQLRNQSEQVKEELANARRELEELKEQMKMNPRSILDLDGREE